MRVAPPLNTASRHSFRYASYLTLLRPVNIFKALSFAALSLLAPGAMAQVVSVGVGPNPAPVGSTVFALSLIHI